MPLLVNRSASSDQGAAPITCGDEFAECSKYFILPFTIFLDMRPTLRTAILALSLFFAFYPLASFVEAAPESSGHPKSGSQGVTIDEVGRGLKSAANHIEEEIPKIGPAIGKTFNQLTGSRKETNRSKESAQRVTPKK